MGLLLRRFTTFPLLDLDLEFVLRFLTAGFFLRSGSLTLVRESGSEEVVDDLFRAMPKVLFSTSVLVLLVPSLKVEAVPRLPKVLLPWFTDE